MFPGSWVLLEYRNLLTAGFPPSSFWAGAFTLAALDVGFTGFRAAAFHLWLTRLGQVIAGSEPPSSAVTWHWQRGVWEVMGVSCH